METEPTNIRSVFEAEFLQAIHDQDNLAMITYLDTLKVKDSSVSEWAAAIGTRLQIRDLFSTEKGQIAALHEINDGDMSEVIRDHLQTLDKAVNSIRGWDPERETTQSPNLLKALRIERLSREDGVGLADLLLGFSSQTVHGFVTTEHLLERLYHVRTGIVEKLWEVATTYREGDVATAKLELEEGVTAINDRLNKNLQGVVDWRNI